MIKMVEQMADPEPELVYLVPDVTCCVPHVRPCFDHMPEDGMQESEYAVYHVTDKRCNRVAYVADCPLPGTVYPAEHVTG